MNVRWMAVITGVLVDTLISSLLVLFASGDFPTSPLLHTTDTVVFVASIVLTGVSGYVAGRMAGVDRTMNGFLVQIVQILIGQLNATPQPRIFTISYVIACGFAALGGYLSRFPAQESEIRSRE